VLSSRANWDQQGRISLWRYTENQRSFPGWHLNADNDGCASLLELIDTLRGHPDSACKLRVSAPSPDQLAAPNNRSAAWFAPHFWLIQHDPSPEHWRLSSDSESATLSAGVHWLDRLREGVAAIPAKQGDYAIGAGRHQESRLWFWWGPS
jgi:hypothetical protein